ncbi:MAG: protein phosphatase 2C domain-containing protein [Pseudomonadota bacterium]
MSWASSGLTHRGNCRSTNEDAILERPDRGLWAVADGMGGHSAGDVASQTICSALAGLTLDGTLADRVDAVEDQLLEVNEALRLYGKDFESEQQPATVGSTVVSLLVDRDVGVALWAGDSRLYRLRHGQLEQVTRDHNPVSDLLDSGSVTEAEALAADTNVVTRAVGGQFALTLDIAVFDLRPGDLLMLCSDGLYRELQHQRLESMLSKRRGPAGFELDELTRELVSQCLCGLARDNLSVVLAGRER